MAFFVGNLVVSVSGCCIDEKAGPLQDLYVELSVGNKLHSTSLPAESLYGDGCGDGCGDGRARESEEYKSNPAFSFHGVSEEDVLTVTVLDRSSSPSRDGREAFVAEAEPLVCSDWGSGGRPARCTCVVAPPEEVVGSGQGRRDRESDGKGASTVQLLIWWSPAIRLRGPLALVATAGRRTERLFSRKLDRPAAALLHLALDTATLASALFQHPRWRTMFVAVSVASLSIGSACLVALAALFLPVTIALVAAASTFVPPMLALAWVLACTGPASELVWRPLLVWAGTRSRLLRTAFLLPVDDVEGEDNGADAVLLGEEAVEMRYCQGERSRAGDVWVPAPAADGLPEDNPVGLVALNGDSSGCDGGDGGGANGGGMDAGAVVLLLACYQNLMGVLHTGLQASRWRPRPR